MLLKIAESTGKCGEGVNLSLRQVSKTMKVIADDQMSSKQRFIMENGQKLQALPATGDVQTEQTILGYACLSRQAVHKHGSGHPATGLRDSFMSAMSH